MLQMRSRGVGASPRNFCPQCGTSTAAGMRERGFGRPDGRPVKELQRNRGRVLMVGAEILIVLGVMGKFSWPGIPIHIGTHHDQRRAPVTIGAEQLYNAYQADPAGADSRFGGREMVVSGTFVRTVPDGYGSIDMRLKTSNPQAPLGVDLDRVSVKEATKLEPGQDVTVGCPRVSQTRGRTLAAGLRDPAAGGRRRSPGCASRSPSAACALRRGKGTVADQAVAGPFMFSSAASSAWRSLPCSRLRSRTCCSLMPCLAAK